MRAVAAFAIGLGVGIVGLSLFNHSTTGEAGDLSVTRSREIEAAIARLDVVVRDMARTQEARSDFIQAVRAETPATTLKPNESPASAQEPASPPNAGSAEDVRRLLNVMWNCSNDKVSGIPEVISMSGRSPMEAGVLEAVEHAYDRYRQIARQIPDPGAIRRHHEYVDKLDTQLRSVRDRGTTSPEGLKSLETQLEKSKANDAPELAQFESERRLILEDLRRSL